MNTSLKILGLSLVSIVLFGCGKKTIEKKDAPFLPTTQSTEEVYFNGLREIKEAVFKSDLLLLKEALIKYPNFDLDQILNEGDTFLIVSVKNNAPLIRDALLKGGANPKGINSLKNTPLMESINEKNLPFFTFFLALEKNLNHTNSDGNTALHLAIEGNQDEMAEALIKKGSPLFAKNKLGQTPFALSQDYQTPRAFELMKRLQNFETGAPDTENFKSILILGNVDYLRPILLRYPNILTDYEVLNPLNILVDSKNELSALEAARFLISYKININGPENAVTPPLIKAVRENKIKFVELFLESNADPRELDQYNRSALYYAIQLNKPQLVKKLLEYNAPKKYNLRRGGGRVYFNACRESSDINSSLFSNEEKKNLKEIRSDLGCSAVRWPF